MGVSKKRGTPKSSIFIGFFIIFTIHFGGKIPLFLVQHPNQTVFFFSLSQPEDPLGVEVLSMVHPRFGGAQWKVWLAGRDGVDDVSKKIVTHPEPSHTRTRQSPGNANDERNSGL